MEEKPVKKLIVFSPIQITAIEQFARDNDIMHGGKPHFSRAVRQLISNGLELDTALHDLKMGRPFEDDPTAD